MTERSMDTFLALKSDRGGHHGKGSDLTTHIVRH